MPRTKKYTNLQVYDIVESEGLGYAVQFYMDDKSIADKELAGYWKQAKEAMDNIQSILDEVILPEDDDGDETHE